MTSHLNIIINNILYLLLYKNNTKNIKEMVRILNISKETLVYVERNRHYERIRKKPTSKWCQYGNKYTMNK
jgi:hypothetical protein